MSDRGHAKIVGQRGDKFLVQPRDGSKPRVVELDKKGIKRGDYLQPHTDKDTFIQKYKYHPQESQREVDRYLKRRGIKPNAEHNPNSPRED